MTALRELLTEVGDEARRADPMVLAAQAMVGADLRRRRARLAAGLGLAGVMGLVVAVSQVGSTRAPYDTQLTGTFGAGSRTPYYSPGLHWGWRFLLAVVVSVLARNLVGWRHRGAPVPKIERELAGLWGGSLALWAFGAFQLVHAVVTGVHFIGHPYVALISAGVVPLLAVALLVNGPESVRRLTVLALAAQSAAVVSLLSATAGSQVFGGPGALSFALTVGQAALALFAAGRTAWRDRTPTGASPSWQLAVVWSVGALVLVNLFAHPSVNPGVIYSVDVPDYLGLGRGALAQGFSWAAGSLAVLLVGVALWRARESLAGLAVVVGLMVAVLAGFSLNLYSNTFPTIGRGWGPYLGFWWLSGLPVLAWLGVHHRGAGVARLRRAR